MGKRSNFDRVDRDFYPTPYEAVVPLIPHLRHGLRFAEPCCGDGALIRHLEAHGMNCVHASDIEPRMDAVTADARGVMIRADVIITNPPWFRPILHALIARLPTFAPTWLLFDADWAYTRQAAPFLGHCTHIVSIGRVKWIPGSSMSGKDNAAWYRFTQTPAHSTTFIGRAAA